MKDDPYDEMRDATVTQHNDLILSSYSMNFLEKRLLHLGMSKVNPLDVRSLVERHQLKINVSAEDWVSAYPDAKNPYRDIQCAAKGMLDRRVTIHPTRDTEHTINWFDSVKINRRCASVELWFTWTIQDLLQGQFENFTTYRLVDMSALRSTHSMRLYEVLMQFKDTGMRMIRLDDFRRVMDCVNKYKETKTLKVKVVKPAITEINAMSRLNIQCQDIREGRRITGFKFWFNPVDPLSKNAEVYDAKKAENLEGDAHLQAAIEFN